VIAAQQRPDHATLAVPAAGCPGCSPAHGDGAND
jgi:hypothetical protein